MNVRHKHVHTYSIVALERSTGRLGVAVQSHFFGVGSIVPWVEAGVGAVATQADADIAYGSLGLALMRAGKTAPAALAALTAADDDNRVRQVGMIDAAGNVAAHTGDRCIPEAGHVTGDGFSAQANLMRNAGVPEAMAEAFQASRGDLLERLMGALEAAEEAGGDIRGRQSAAVVVARGPDEPQLGYSSAIADLRIDDDERPLLALRRLVSVWRGYRWMDQATEAIEAGEMKQAEAAYEKMRGLVVGNREPMFWYAVALVNEGHVENAIPVFGEVFAHDRVWLEVLDRLVTAGYFPDDESLLKRVRAVAPKG